MLLLVLTLQRLTMDGSTKASQHLSIVSLTDIYRLSYDVSETAEDLNNIFKNCIEVVHKMKARCMFGKSWMALPINMNNQHWGLLCLLNPTYLAEEQDKMFTAYFFYDPMCRDLCRAFEMEIMMRKGVLNFLVYANMAFGNPRILPSIDSNDLSRVRNMLLDDKVFTRICVPRGDSVEQRDGYNCGVYLLFCLQEMSLLHTAKYKAKSDFVSVRDSEDVAFKSGEFFSLYFPPTQKRPPNGGLSHAMLAGFRDQTLCLFNRILTLKSPIDEETNAKKTVKPIIPSQTPPNWFRQNMRRLAWEIEDRDQIAINTYMEWLQSKRGTLQTLIGCDNQVLSNPDNIFELTDGDEYETVNDVPDFTEKELEDAGMQQLTNTITDYNGENDEKADSINDGDKKRAAVEKEPNKENAASALKETEEPGLERATKLLPGPGTKKSATAAHSGDEELEDTVTECSSSVEKPPTRRKRITPHRKGFTSTDEMPIVDAITKKRTDVTDQRRTESMSIIDAIRGG